MCHVKNSQKISSFPWEKEAKSKASSLLATLNLGEKVCLNSITPFLWHSVTRRSLAFSLPGWHESYVHILEKAVDRQSCNLVFESIERAQQELNYKIFPNP